MMHEARLFLVQGGLPQEADDATLVHKLLDQHPLAARIIWQRLAPMIHGMLRRSFGRDDDIEDLAQECSCTSFREPPRCATRRR